MIYLASDHAGYELKTALTAFLKQEGFEAVDLGPDDYDATDDYPDFILPAAQRVAREDQAVGIVIGGSGQGEALAANKVPGIRAALYYGGPLEIVTLSRTHNNANILSLGARFLSEGQACEAALLWLRTEFTDAGRHLRRLEKLRDFEKARSKA